MLIKSVRRVRYQPISPPYRTPKLWVVSVTFPFTIENKGFYLGLFVCLFVSVEEMTDVKLKGEKSIGGKDQRRCKRLASQFSISILVFLSWFRSILYQEILVLAKFR